MVTRDETERAASAGAMEWAGAARRGLTVNCFGCFEVCCDGRLVRWERDKARTLFKHLVLRCAPISRDWVCDALWSELDGDSAMVNFRVTLHSLRKTLSLAGPDVAASYVVQRGPIYQLNPGAPLWVDTSAFSAHIDSANRLWRHGEHSRAVADYKAAAMVYRDDFLIDDHDDWTSVPREQFKDQYLMALGRLLEMAMSERDFDGVIELAHRMLAKDAGREEAYVGLMRAHAALGHPGRALRWYGLCRAALQRELDQVPEDSTVELAAAIGARGIYSGRLDKNQV